ncbi:MAG: response regulator transcription factor [Spirochaetaceae bacterium]|nr:response regulator transcription factor [Spirochaetaceae bacterium]
MVRIVVLMETERDRKYFETLLSSRSGYKVVGVGQDGYHAIRLMQRHKPDIVLVDEKTPLFDRGKSITSLLFWSPQTKIILLTSNLKRSGAAKRQDIKAGTRGYFDDLPGDMIFAGINLVMQGWSVINPNTMELAFRGFSEMPVFAEKGPQKRAGSDLVARMSRQELRLLACIGQGLSRGELSQTLKLSHGTIRNYLSSIYTKTGVRNRTEAALFARQLGLPSLERAKEPGLGDGS